MTSGTGLILMYVSTRVSQMSTFVHYQPFWPPAVPASVLHSSYRTNRSPLGCKSPHPMHNFLFDGSQGVEGNQRLIICHSLEKLTLEHEGISFIGRPLRLGQLVRQDCGA